MMYYNSQKKSGTITLRVVCAVCFLVFSFLWLYFFEADAIAVAQHALSHGMTTYFPLVGAIIMTSVLYGLQCIISTFVKIPRNVYALTYVPSMLIIAFVSDIDSDIDIVVNEIADDSVTAADSGEEEG